MNRIGFAVSGLAGLILFSTVGFAEDARPEVQEVRELIRTRLPGVSEADLDRAAVAGLLAGFPGRVQLATNANNFPPSGGTNLAALRQAVLVDGGVAWVQVARVVEGLAGKIAGATRTLAATNRLQGLVLDLRFAGGGDFAAAAAAADLFVAKPKRLFDWGRGMVEAKAKKDAIALPLVVLVNGETTGAAEALAAALRENGPALLLGAQTAGRATPMQEFPLRNGQRLLIASGTVTLGSGAVLGGDGVKPDIAVTVAAADEKIFYADPYALPAQTNPPAPASLAATNAPAITNRPPRKRLSEAELVRKHREGTNDAEDFAAPADAEPRPPVLRDPALARAVDLLKGLALVRPGRGD